MSIHDFHAEIAAGNDRGVYGRVRRLMTIEDPEVVLEGSPGVRSSGLPSWDSASWPLWNARVADLEPA